MRRIARKFLPVGLIVLSLVVVAGLITINNAKRPERKEEAVQATMVEAIPVRACIVESVGIFAGQRYATHRNNTGGRGLRNNCQSLPQFCCRWFLSQGRDPVGDRSQRLPGRPETSTGRPRFTQSSICRPKGSCRPGPQRLEEYGPSRRAIGLDFAQATIGRGPRQCASRRSRLAKSETGSGAHSHQVALRRPGPDQAG